MKSVGRLLFAGLTAVGVYFTFVFLSNFITDDHGDVLWRMIVPGVLGSGLGILVWIATRKHGNAAVLRILLTTAVVGVIGFLTGYVGPIILSLMNTDSGGDQGPLLGIFVTGPLACILGLVVGSIREIRAS